MNYVTYPHAGSDDADLRLTWVGPTMRAVGNGLAVLGGGILFALTLYLMIVLPALL